MEQGADKFKVVDIADDKVVLEKEITTQTSHAGTFNVFDFSEVTAPGRYKLVYCIKWGYYYNGGRLS